MTDDLVSRAELTETKTGRGFARVEFRDSHGVACSIQKSSLATEDAIWIGADDLGLKRFPGDCTGWHDVDLSEIFPGQDIVANTSMHLTQDQVRAILPVLFNFVETGEVALPAAQVQAEPVAGTPITMTYRNYRGEVDRRTVLPTRIWFGSTDWHPEPGWLMSAYDLAKAAHRDFALADCQFADLSPAPDDLDAQQVTLTEALALIEKEGGNG